MSLAFALAALKFLGWLIVCTAVHSSDASSLGVLSSWPEYSRLLDSRSCDLEGTQLHDWLNGASYFAIKFSLCEKILSHLPVLCFAISKVVSFSKSIDENYDMLHDLDDVFVYQVEVHT
jgi:hypothetical protein